MTTPPIPDNEAERLKSLQDLDILDTPSEFRFDRITRLTAQSLDTEYSELNLIDEEREWSKSQYPSGQSEIPRDDSFCAHVIVSD
ncbi:MAG: hypothetical protein ABEK50_17685 [bacterium]